jgi:hypothetical protein
VVPAITLPARYNGPPGSANGGFACGVVARHAAAALGFDVAVTLHAPPPLDVPLELRTDGRRAHLWAGEELVAGAARASGPVEAVPQVPPQVARAAQDGFAGLRHHPFPTCFVCGPERSDGLDLRPGPVPGLADTVACAWTPPEWLAPDGTVAPEFIWAVLDCPGGWTRDPASQTMVLGRMAACLDALPRVGRRYVVVGRLLARDGRTSTNLTALYDERGTLLARARAIWVAVTGVSARPDRPDGRPGSGSRCPAS